MDRTVVITGAAGNLGQKLMAHFRSLGWTVRGIDMACGGKAGIVEADLTEWDESWVGLMAGAEAVVHLAGRPSPRISWQDAVRFNIDMTQTVMEAAARGGARRLVFASSNWTMAGYRFDDVRLTTELAPWPTNPYGMSKLAGERLGRSYYARWGLSVVCLRIGYCQRGENLPGATMGMNGWGQSMWLSNRDLCHGFERAVAAEHVGFAVLNLMSDNPGMRWDIEETRRVIGYAPRNGASPVLSETQVAEEALLARTWTATLELEAALAERSA